MVFAVTKGMRLALFASLLLAFACGGDDGLTVSGQVAVDADGTPTGFDFVERTKLVDLTYEEDSGTVMAGACVIDTGIDGPTTLTLQAPGAPPEGLGLHRFQLVYSPVTGTLVSAQLGTDDYSAVDGAADCFADVLYRDDDDRTVGVEVDCELTGPGGATASVVSDLHFNGCTVEGPED